MFIRKETCMDKETTMGVYEFRTHISEMLQRVSAGEEVTITKHGNPIARLVPAQRKHSPEEVRAAFDRLRRGNKGLSLGGLKVKDLIREGRR
jgi:prevent-host-death family protein